MVSCWYCDAPEQSTAKCQKCDASLRSDLIKEVVCDGISNALNLSEFKGRALFTAIDPERNPARVEITFRIDDFRHTAAALVQVVTRCESRMSVRDQAHGPQRHSARADKSDYRVTIPNDTLFFFEVSPIAEGTSLNTAIQVDSTFYWNRAEVNRPVVKAQVQGNIDVHLLEDAFMNGSLLLARSLARKTRAEMRANFAEIANLFGVLWMGPDV